MTTFNKLLLSLSAIFLVSCQSPTLQNASKGINSSPAMWQATKGGHSVYLLGSVHILPSQVKWYTPRIKQAFNSSEQIMFEVLDNESTKREYKSYISANGFLPNGRTIDKYLTKKEYAKYQQVSQEISLNSYYADRMKPWLFFMAINSIISKDYTKYGVDNLLEEDARSQGKPLYALETVSQALAPISSVPISKEIRNLKKFLSPKKPNRKETQLRSRLMIAWATGDTSTAKRLLSKSIMPSEYKKMIIKRNNNWYPKIQQIVLQKRQSMVVVGLAHLIGRGNIIDKLKRSGYTVKRVQ